jgi:hypothetical protein
MKLYESLFILHKSNLTIQRLWKIIEDQQERIHEIANTAVLIIHHITMETVSFMDEFEGDFHNKIEPEFYHRMMNVRKITAPIVKKIKYQQLKKFRNEIVAHPWRDKKGNFVLPDDNKFDVPANWFEAGLLVRYVQYTFELVTKEFRDEIREAMNWVSKQGQPSNPKKDISNTNQELYDLAKEVGALCKELNKPYNLQVMLYEMDGFQFNEVMDNGKPVIRK